MVKGLPTSGPVSIDEHETHESLRGLEARIKALEALPHTIDAEFIKVKAGPTTSAVFVTLRHGLKRVPRGAWMIAQGELDEVIANDVIMTVHWPDATDKTMKVAFLRAIGAAGTVRTFHLLVF